MGAILPLITKHKIQQVRILFYMGSASDIFERTETVSLCALCVARVLVLACAHSSGGAVRFASDGGN